MVQIPRSADADEGTVPGGQRMGRGTVLRHPAVTPVLTLSLTRPRAPLAPTQPRLCGSAEETRQIPGCGRGSTGAQIAAVGCVSPQGQGQGCAPHVPLSPIASGMLLIPPWGGALKDTSGERSTGSQDVSCHYGNSGGAFSLG